jgi:hypothetical protein
MKKSKLLMVFVITILLLLSIPNASNATDEYTYQDAEQGITWSYELDNSGNIVNLICKTSSKQGKVTIPSTIEGKTVISIGNSKNDYSWYASAFANHAGITEVVIPDTIATIGYRAFYNCSGLKTVTMPDSVTKIGGEAFANCTGLTQLTLSKNVTSIGEYAFENCKGIKTISIPNGVSSLSKGIFKACTGLTEMTIPGNISTIEAEAFDNCTGIKKITIPDNINNIGNDAFYGCTGLTEVTLSNNLTTIGEAAFYGCTGLKTIIIPDTVTTIESSAFKGCRGLKQITLSKGLTAISASTFGDCSGLTSVVIPDTVTTIDSDGDWGFGAFEGCTNLSKILIPDSVASIGKDTFAGCNKLTIYGNDDQESKRYAVDNEITFDYIANWNKADSGQDVTSPTVNCIEVTYASISECNKDKNTNSYIVPEGKKIVIRAIFNEQIQGEAPTLTIRFGQGPNIELTEGTVTGSEILYTYTVKKADKGIMATVKFEGGTIKDAVGNEATLSCPTLTIEYDIGNKDYIYANGTGTSSGGNSNDGAGTDSGDNSNDGAGTGSGDNSNDGAGTGSGDNSNDGAGTGSESNSSKDKGKETKDPTTAPQIIPNAGLGMGIITAIIVILAIGIITFFKYRNLKNV